MGMRLAFLKKNVKLNASKKCLNSSAIAVSNTLVYRFIQIGVKAIVICN